MIYYFLHRNIAVLYVPMVKSLIVFCESSSALIMKKFIILIYGLISYAIGLGGLSYFFLFVGGWEFLPFHVDSGTPSGTASAVAVNLALVLLFAVHHSIAARSSFKRASTSVIPRAIERSTYVLFSGIILLLMCYQWRAIPGTIWRLDNSFVQIFLISLQLMGWTIVVAATFMINHFELMGLQRVYYYFRATPEPTPEFTDRFLYKIVRHPIQFGLLLGLWSTPYMSAAHLLLSLSLTVYIFVGLYFEEIDLCKLLGADYENYRDRVRMLIPIPK